MELRPSRSAYRRRGARSAPFALLVVLGFVRATFAVDSATARVAFVVAAVSILSLVLAMFIAVPRTVRLRLLPERVELRGWFVRGRVVAFRDVAQVVTVRMPNAVVMLLDHGGRRLLALDSQLWTGALVADVVAAVGAPYEPAIMSSKQLRQRYPDALTWPYAHPLAFALWFTLAWVIIVIVGFVIVTI